MGLLQLSSHTSTVSQMSSFVLFSCHVLGIWNRRTSFWVKTCTSRSQISGQQNSYRQKVDKVVIFKRFCVRPALVHGVIFLVHYLRCSESQLLCRDGAVRVSRAANGEIRLQEVVKFVHTFFFLVIVTWEWRNGYKWKLNPIVFLCSALIFGPWVVLSISWWLVYHRLEQGEY